jgi:hypothetical protein
VLEESLVLMKVSKRFAAASLLVGLSTAAPAWSQVDSGTPTVAAQMAEMLHRGAGGHSPTTDEVQTVEGLPGVTNAAVAKEVEPLLAKALGDPDAAMRKYALAMLIGMQSLPDGSSAGGQSTGVTAQTKGSSSAAAAPGVAVYKSEVAKALAPLLPLIGDRLTDDDPDNRLLAATDLGGFSPSPPAAVYTALLGFLKRDDAVGAVGLAAVSDLLQIGPVSDETATAVARYLRRPDQTSDMRANLVDAIASKQNQNQIVDKALLSYLDSDDASLRARTILSLPQMDLAADVFADTKARVADLAAGGQDSLQVVNAAKAVTGCWTQVKMTSGCPVY